MSVSPTLGVRAEVAPMAATTEDSTPDRSDALHARITKAAQTLGTGLGLLPSNHTLKFLHAEERTDDEVRDLMEKESAKAIEIHKPEAGAEKVWTSTAASLAASPVGMSVCRTPVSRTASSGIGGRSPHGFHPTASGGGRTPSSGSETPYTPGEPFAVSRTPSRGPGAASPSAPDTRAARTNPLYSNLQDFVARPPLPPAGK